MKCVHKLLLICRLPLHLHFSGHILARMFRGYILHKKVIWWKRLPSVTLTSNDLVTRQVMRECWRHAPEDRPSFRMLKEELAGVAQSVLADWLRLLLSLLRPAPPAPAQSPSSTASLRPSPAAHPPPATTLPRARRLHAASPVWYYARATLALSHAQNMDGLLNEHTTCKHVYLEWSDDDFELVNPTCSVLFFYIPITDAAAAKTAR